MVARTEESLCLQGQSSRRSRARLSACNWVGGCVVEIDQVRIQAPLFTSAERRTYKLQV
jgi:hypothetical protein